MDASDQIVFNEAQVVLAEKRTYLAMMRTGLAVLALPMGVVSLLIGLSKLYQSAEVLGYLIPLLAFCAALAGLGVYVIWRSVVRLRRAEMALSRLKERIIELRGPSGPEEVGL